MRTIVAERAARSLPTSSYLAWVKECVLAELKVQKDKEIARTDKEIAESQKRLGKWLAMHSFGHQGLKDIASAALPGRDYSKDVSRWLASSKNRRKRARYAPDASP
jgi:hypothetical protein